MNKGDKKYFKLQFKLDDIDVPHHDVIDMNGKSYLFEQVDEEGELWKIDGTEHHWSRRYLVDVYKVHPTLPLSISSELIESGKILSNKPIDYRLAKKKDGSLILQGAYEYSQGNYQGVEWKEIPIVELD